MSDKMKLTVPEARRLHDEVASLTIKELRATSMKYGWGDWLSSVRKPQMVKALKQKLSEFIVKNGGKAPT